MSDIIDPTTQSADSNPDPITGEPGAHPVGVAAGAAAGGAAGAAIGAVAGPVGVAAGTAIGVVAGGLAGKSVAERIDPTNEDDYWRTHHASQPYGILGSYERYSNAYRAGYQGVSVHGLDKGYDEVEGNLKSAYEESRAGTGPTWENARHAVRAAFERTRDNLKKAQSSPGSADAA